MIKLDTWESQFVYLSKNWFSYSPKKYLMSKEEDYRVAKKIWAERCGIELEYVQIKDINYFLIKLCNKLGLFNTTDNIVEFIMSLSPFDRYFNSSKTEVTINNWQWAMKIFSTCMTYLQMIQVRDCDKSGNFYDIIHLENLETKFKMVEPDKEEAMKIIV